MADRLTEDDIARGIELSENREFYVYQNLYRQHAFNHYPAALQELAELRAEVARLTEELDATRPTWEFVVSLIGQPDKPGVAVSWWGDSMSWDHTGGGFAVGPYYEHRNLTSRAAVRAHVEAMKGAK
jgi:hypothetical protein